MATAAPTSFSVPNPYDDPSSWGQVFIGGLLLPGVVEKIDGCEKPEQWNVQKATEKANASTVWKGTELAESMEIVMRLPTRASFAALIEVRDTLRPKIGKKPPSLSIVNPKVNWSGITRVSCRDVTSPEWNESGGFWTSTVKLIEYNPPKPTNTGPASAAKASDAKSGQPDPNADVKAELDKALKEAQKL